MKSRNYFDFLNSFQAAQESGQISDGGWIGGCALLYKTKSFWLQSSLSTAKCHMESFWFHHNLSEMMILAGGRRASVKEASTHSYSCAPSTWLPEVHPPRCSPQIWYQEGNSGQQWPCLNVINCKSSKIWDWINGENQLQITNNSSVHKICFLIVMELCQSFIFQSCRQKQNIATGKTPKAITPFQLVDYFCFSLSQNVKKIPCDRKLIE